MKELGAKLKEAREKKGITLQQIQEKTRIGMRYLEALEEGRFEETPGEVYLKGFLRSYAEVVGLDPDAVVAEYKTLKAARAKEEVLSEEGVAGPEVPEKEPGLPVEKPKKVREVTRVQFTAIMIALVLIMSGLVSTLIMTYMAEHPEPATHQETAVEEGHPSTEEPASGNEVAGEPAAVRPPEETKAAVELKASFIDVCWASVAADGQVVFEGTLNRGEEKEWTAQHELRIRLGRAGAVRLFFNGQPVENVGKEVVYLSFTPEGMKRLPIPKPVSPADNTQNQPPQNQ